MLITKADVQSALGRVLADLPNPYIDERYTNPLKPGDSWRPAMSTCLSGAVLAELPINFDLQNPCGGIPVTCLAGLGHNVDDESDAYLRELVMHNDARRNWHDAPRT